jgi:gliding motility-associated-like protein
LWNTGDTSSAIQIYTEWLYSVSVTSTEQCKSTDSVTILFSGEPFWMPNAFSPNGDGLNDVFKPVQRYDYVSSYHFSVYSRWGELIFETSDIEQGWDGNHKGKLAPLGSYVYRIVYTAHSTGTETQVKSGTIMLVK